MVDSSVASTKTFCYSGKTARLPLTLFFFFCYISCFRLQIVLTVSQTMWCRDITECLITEGDRLEAMKGAEDMCVKVRQVKLLFAFTNVNARPKGNDMNPR